MLMLVVRRGGVRKNLKRGLADFRNSRRALDFGAMLRAADFSGIWREGDAHNSFFPAKTRDWGLVRKRWCWSTTWPFFHSLILRPVPTARSSFPQRLLVNETPVLPNLIADR